MQGGHQGFREDTRPGALAAHRPAPTTTIAATHTSPTLRAWRGRGPGGAGLGGVRAGCALALPCLAVPGRAGGDKGEGGRGGLSG